MTVTNKHSKKSMEITPKNIWRNLQSYIRLLKRMEKEPGAAKLLEEKFQGSLIRYQSLKN